MNSKSSKALSIEKPRKAGAFIWIFFAIFFVAGTLMLYFLTFQPLWGVLNAGDWVETACEIVSSKVGVHHGDDGATYSIDIQYRYNVDGVDYDADRYSFMVGSSSSGRAAKADVVRNYPKGSKQICYIDPDDPSSAVLDPDLSSAFWFCLFPIPFFAVGAGGLAYLVRRKIRGPVDHPDVRFAPGIDRQQVQVVDTTPSKTYASRNQFAATSGPIELKPNSTPGCRFVGATFAAIFWNGIISIFVFQVSMNFDWFFAIFLIPFVLVGFGLIGAVFYTGFGLLNARPILTLSMPSIPLGGTAELSWRFSRSFHSVQRLKISIRAEEQATFRRGTDTITEKETFFEDVLIDAQGMMPEVTRAASISKFQPTGCTRSKQVAIKSCGVSCFTVIFR